MLGGRRLANMGSIRRKMLLNPRGVHSRPTVDQAQDLVWATLKLGRHRLQHLPELMDHIGHGCNVREPLDDVIEFTLARDRHVWSGSLRRSRLDIGSSATLKSDSMGPVIHSLECLRIKSMRPIFLSKCLVLVGRCKRLGRFLLPNIRQMRKLFEIRLISEDT